MTEKGSTDRGPTTAKQTNLIPIDRGWAWVILAASWMNMFITIGTFKTFGIIFTEIQEKYHTSASLTSIITSLHNVGFGISTLCVQVICLEHLSTRQVVMGGSVVMCLSYVISAFSPIVEVLLVTQGFVPGIAVGLMFAPTSSLIGQYFHEKRGLAMSITTMGGSVGSLYFSFFLRICLDTFGFSNTLMLTGAVCLHGLVSGSLQRPVTFYRQSAGTRRSLVLAENDSYRYVMEKHATDGVAVETDQGKLSSPLLQNTMSTSAIRNETGRHERVRTYSQNCKGHIAESAKITSALNQSPYTWKFASTECSSSLLKIDKSESDYQKETISTRNTSCCVCRPHSQSNLSSVIVCSVCKKPSFLLCLLFGCLLSVGCSLTLVFLPAHAKDIGLSDSEGSSLITVLSIADICSVPLWGIVADKRWTKSRNVAALAATIFGVTTFFIPLYCSFHAMVFYSVIYGVFGRVWFSLYTLALVELVGLENLKTSLGILLLCQTTTTSTMILVVGLMRDYLGSYVPCYQLMATSLILGSFGMVILQLVVNYEQKHQTNYQNSQMNTVV